MTYFYRSVKYFIDPIANPMERTRRVLTVSFSILGRKRLVRRRATVAYMHVKAKNIIDDYFKNGDRL